VRGAVNVSIPTPWHTFASFSDLIHTLDYPLSILLHKKPCPESAYNPGSYQSSLP